MAMNINIGIERSDVSCPSCSEDISTLCGSSDSQAFPSVCLFYSCFSASSHVLPSVTFYPTCCSHLDLRLPRGCFPKTFVILSSFVLKMCPYHLFSVVCQFAFQCVYLHILFFISYSLSFGFPFSTYILFCTPYDKSNKQIVDFEPIFKKLSGSDIKYFNKM
jgi:hypothetical protein